MYHKAFRVVVTFAILAAVTSAMIYELVPMSRLDVAAAQEKDAKATAVKKEPVKKDSAKKKPAKKEIVPDPRQTGGEPESVVQVANLVYAGVKSSQCFSDHFLVKAEKETSISTSRRFHAVKLDSEEIYGYPLLIMTGEGSFQLPDSERASLRRYLERGGFLLASAGCSSAEWDRSFRREMAAVFTETPMRPLGMDHPVFHTVADINQIKVKHGKPRPMEGLSLGGRLAILYSVDGLNDTSHTTGCCCCGGNEIRNAAAINVNVLAYALTY